MENPPRNNAGYRLTAAAALVVVAAGAVSRLSPGGLGDPGPLRVVDGASAQAYRTATRSVVDAPPWAAAILEVATDGVLVVLGLLLVWVWWAAVRREDGHGVAGTVVIGIGTVAAYATSEALKLAVDEDRPCRVVTGAATALAECPAVGDWSFPSNHATLAAGLAVGLAVLRPRIAAAAVPLAVVAAVLRVVVGVHYPHDVLAGAILGASLVAAAGLALTPPATRLVSRLPGWAPRDDAGLVGHRSFDTRVPSRKRSR